ncbi:hypothetical protein RKE25_13355 [Dyella sp. BiH032]|uniref:hypothetical protein n=1 Tax=Dyella sp. BiH032 TaxID=3075430 RepID=UPI002892F0FC|nr:hypothetical protein [Dyella sp. BiH032]WNL44416.1 hypothetical protein RKE25_13355 [Dyella sp. BiH032]
MQKLAFPTALPIALSLSAFLALTGCTSSNVDFSIDNPTEAPLKLQIDGTAYEIPAHQAKELTLKAGGHTLDAPATGTVKFNVYAERKGALINPTLSDYVIVSATYVTEASKAKNFMPAGGGPFQLDGVEFHGPFELADSLFIEKDWRFGVTEPFPDSLTGYDAGNGGNIFRKIFTAPDFVAYFEKQTGQPGFFEKNRQHAAAAPHKPVPPAPLPAFTDPGLQNASLKLRDLYERYQHATDPAEQQRLQSEHHQLTMDFVTAYASRGAKLPSSDNETYNVFIRRSGAIMGQSALVAF